MIEAKEATPPSVVGFLPPSLYEAAEKQGFDMRYYRRQEPMPTTYQRLNFGPELD